MNTRHLIILIAIGVGVAGLSRVRAIQPSVVPYYIEDLGEFGPDMFPHVAAINNLGDVVGRVTSRVDTADFRPWRRLNGAGVSEILGNERGEATAINDERAIAGTAILADGSWRAFRYTDEAGFEDLGTLGGTQSLANGINGTGDVVGASFIPYNVELHAFRTVGNTLQDLGALLGPHSGATIATGINNAGQVAAVVYGSGPYFFFNLALRFTSGIGWEPLGSLGGQGSEAAAINASGQVCGMAVTGYNPYPRRHAFRYTDGIGMVDLTPDRPGALAAAMNDRGDVVGSFIFGNGDATPDNPYHAFLYTDGAGLEDLNDAIDPSTGWVLNYAYGINNAGQIVGDGQLNGQPRSFKLTKDVVAPVITTAATSVDALWPPDGRMVPVSMTIAAQDDFDPAPSCRVAGITTSEPDGTTQFTITGPMTVTLQAARDGGGPGRVYDIAVACGDRSGNMAQRRVTVRVPHDGGQ
jgi:probable HAF family extracellular repeat protein